MLAVQAFACRIGVCSHHLSGTPGYLASGTSALSPDGRPERLAAPH